jgi:hypothetical protein
MSAPDSSTRKKTGRQTVGDSSGKDSTRRRTASADNSNSMGDHSSPNMSPNKSAKGGGSGKASGGGMLAAKDGRTAQQILAPKRATTDGSTPADKNNSKSGDNSKDNSKSGAEKRALPGGKGADKNPKSRKTMLKEKEKEHTFRCFVSHRYNFRQGDALNADSDRLRGCYPLLRDHINSCLYLRRFIPPVRIQAARQIACRDNM